MYVHVCIYICMYVCMHVYTHFGCIPMCMYTCIPMRMHTCIPIYMYTCIAMWMYTCIQISLNSCASHLYIYIYIYIYVHVLIYVSTQSRADIHHIQHLTNLFLSMQSYTNLILYTQTLFGHTLIYFCTLQHDLGIH